MFAYASTKSRISFHCEAPNEPGLLYLACARNRTRSVPASRLRSWMMRAIHLLEPFLHHVRINLGGGNVGMSEHHLHRSQIRAAIQKMRGETVTQHVRL